MPLQLTNVIAIHSEHNFSMNFSECPSFVTLSMLEQSKKSFIGLTAIVATFQSYFIQCRKRTENTNDRSCINSGWRTGAFNTRINSSATLNDIINLLMRLAPPTEYRLYKDE